MKVGDHVQKVKGYKWPGVVVAVFKTLAGADRYVVECTVPEVAGALHIYSRDQLETKTCMEGICQQPANESGYCDDCEVPF